MKWLKCFTFTLIFLVACHAPEADVEESEMDSFVYTRNPWRDPTAIPVCFLNGNILDQEILTDLQTFVSQEYEKKVGIRFVEWKSCQSVDLRKPFIRISFQITNLWGGGWASYGPIPGTGTTMLLKMGGRSYAGNPSWNRGVTRSTALHEFGHALGLVHEHERSDAKRAMCDTGNVRIQPQRSENSSEKFVGAYDPDSIMKYCGNPTQQFISNGDIAGLRYLYPQLGGKPSGPVTELSFGPFGASENKVLTQLEANGKKYVDLNLELDTEFQEDCSFDHVLILDGSGVVKRYCNKTKFQLVRLKTPVKVIFVSDELTHSQSVKLKDLKFHDGSP